METWGASSSPAFYCLGCKNESGSLEPMHVVSQKLDSARTGLQQTRGWDLLRGSRPAAFLLRSWEPGLDRARPPPQQASHVRRSRDDSSCFWEGRHSVLTGSSADAVPSAVLMTALMENKWRRCPDSGRLTSAVPRTGGSVLCLPVGRAVQIIVWAVTSTALTGCADGVPACAWLVSRTRLCSRDGFHRAGLVDSRGRSWGLQGHI